ncbi:MAG: DUF3810 family protein [Christensenellales bacterium]
MLCSLQRHGGCEKAEARNDTYLKANQQTDGTKSYGRMVDLLLAAYRARLADMP